MTTPSLSVQFRKAAEKDLPAISKIQVEAFWSPEKSADYFSNRDSKPVTGFIQSVFNRGRDGHLIVAEDAEKNVVGYVIVNALHFATDNFINIDSMAIDKNYRGRGIGRALMVEAERLTREDGYPSLLLQVEETNTPAVKLYKDMGYQKLNYLKDYNGPGRHYLEMQKPLKPFKPKGGMISG